jgi:hypothetical protein
MDLGLLQLSLCSCALNWVSASCPPTCHISNIYLNAENLPVSYGKSKWPVIWKEVV